MSDVGLRAGEVRTGAAYESARAGERARLAETSEQRRIELGHDLVLVFETPQSVRAALEESLRAQRVTEPDRVAAETAAFAELLPQPGELVATLFVEIADPAALADRVAELGDVAAALSLEVGGRRVRARVDKPSLDGGATRVVFDLAEAGVDLEPDAPVAVAIAHPALRARAAVTGEQLRALAQE